MVDQNRQFEDINLLLIETASRASLTVEVVFDAMTANLLGMVYPELREMYVKRFVQDIDDLQEAHRLCSTGDYGTGRVSEQVTALRKDSFCDESVLESATYHESYGCLSVDSGVPVFIDMAQSLQPILGSRHMLNDPKFIHFLHFQSYHLSNRLNRIRELVMEFGYEKAEECDTLVKIIVERIIVDMNTTLSTACCCNALLRH